MLLLRVGCSRSLEELPVCEEMTVSDGMCTMDYWNAIVHVPSEAWN